MSTLKVNNIEPTSGDNIRLTGNITFITPAGKEIEFNDSDTNFDGPVTITGSLSTDKGDVLINEGNLILKSGSLLIGSGSLNQQTTSGSTSASYWSVTSSIEITGSEGSDWTVSVIGDSDFQGDVTISGCLDINCYNDEGNPIFWAIDGRTTPSPTGFEYVSINFNTYGDLTSGIAAAAAASNNVCYIYDPATGTYAPYGYSGTNFDGTVTYISASGPEIITGELVQIGFPTPISGATPIYPIGTGSLTPIASFCCDGITLYSDVTISGGLDVYGPTNLHDGLIVTGCIEMYCPGDETTAWYGYEGSVRFSKPSASVYLNYTWLDASYGDVRTVISASAAANGGTLQLYNTVTGTTQTVNYISSTWTQTLTIIEYSTPTLTAYSPMPVIHIGNQTPDLQPDGADILMGSGSATPTQTATFCCDGNVLYGDTTFTGSVTITGSTSTSGSVTTTGPVEITGSVNIKGDGKVDGNLTLPKIIGAGTGSGDGNNYSTIELIPDNDLYNNDQYLIIDPTAPNHVHIRPGGIIDDSAADLIIGGEDTHLIVSDSSNEVKMKRQSTIFINSYTFTSGSGYSTAEWSSDGTTHIVTINDPSSSVYDATYAVIPTPPSIFAVVTDAFEYFQLEVLNISTPGGPSPITLTVNQAPPTNSISLSQVDFEINQYSDAYVRVTNDVTIEAVDDVRIYSRDVFSLRNYSVDEAIDIVTRYNSSDENNWSFSFNGNTIFPYLTTPRGDTSGGNLTANTLRLGDGTDQAVISTPDGSEFNPSSQRLVINPGQGSGSYEGGDIYLWAGRGGVDGGSGGDVKVRGGYGPTSGGGGYVRIEGGDTTDGSAGFVEIRGGTSNTSTGGTVDIHGGFGNGNTQNGNVTVNTYDVSGLQKSWVFDTEGTLSLPDLLKLPVRTTDPGTPVEGMIMASGSAGSSVLYYYNGTSWNALF